MDEKTIHELWSKTIGAEQLERGGGGTTYKGAESLASKNVYLPLMTLLNKNDTSIEVITPKGSVISEGDETINETATGTPVQVQETAVDNNSPVNNGLQGDQTLDNDNSSVNNDLQGDQTLDDQTIATETLDNDNSPVNNDLQGDQTLDDQTIATETLDNDNSPVNNDLQGDQTLDDQTIATETLDNDNSPVNNDLQGDQTLDDQTIATEILDNDNSPVNNDLQGDQTLDANFDSKDDLIKSLPDCASGNQTLDGSSEELPSEISDLEKGAQTLFDNIIDEKSMSAANTIIGAQDNDAVQNECLEDSKTICDDDQPQQKTPQNPLRATTTHSMKDTLHDGIKSKLDSRSENFVIGTEIARGGMGIINKGEQKSLKREIAIKRIIPGSINNVSQQKFISEALVTAYLDHPNIVPVYELGQNINGNVFLTMKLVKGVEWKKILNKTAENERFKQYDLEAHLRILLDVCDAMAFAHNKGIVHNDLKPENIMIGEFGEVLVMDWGLAVSRDEISPELRTLHKSMVTSPMGTPHYMSPELAEGCGKEIGPWTDTYLLGAILHEIITGKPPHYDENIWKSLMKAIASDKPSFDQKRDDLFIEDHIPHELKDICSKSLSKLPEDRFQDVDDFKKAIAYFLKHRESLIISGEGQKILEENQQAQDKKLKGKQRNHLYAEFSKAVSCFEQSLKLWTGNTIAKEGRYAARIAYSTIALRNDDLGLSEAQIDELDRDDPQVQQVRQQIQQAKQQKIKAEKSSQRVRLLLLGSVLLTFLVLSVSLYFIRQEHLLAEKNATQAKKQEAIAKVNSKEAQEQRDIAKRETEKVEKQKKIAEEAARRAEFERMKAKREERIRFAEAKAAKKTLAKISLQKASEAFDNQQWKDSLLFSSASLELTKNLPPDEVDEIRNKNKKFVKLALMKEGLVWETTPHYSTPVSHITSSQDGKMLASVTTDSNVHLWDTSTGRLNNIFQQLSAQFTFCVFHPYNKEIAAVSQNHNSIHIWSIDENSDERILRGHQREIVATIYLDEGYKLVSISKDKTIRIWNTQKQELISTMACKEIPRSSFDVHLEDSKLVYLSTNNRIIVWDLASKKRIYLSKESYRAITLHPNKQQITVIDSKNKLQMLSTKDFSSLKNIDLPTKALSLSYSADGNNLIVFSSKQATLFEASSLKLIAKKSFTSQIHEAHYNDHLQAIVGINNQVYVYPFSKSREQKRAIFHRPKNIKCLRYGPDMKTIAISSDNLLQLLDQHGKYIGEWKSASKIRDIAYHPNSSFIATANKDNSIFLWNTRKQKAQKMVAHDGEITMLQIAPNQQLYATVAKDNTVCLWDTKGELIRSLKGHSAEINDIAFLPDSSGIISTAEDRTIRIWDTNTGRVKQTLKTNESIYKLSCSPDGKKLAGSSRKSVYLWNAKTGKPIRKYNGHKKDITCLTFDRTSNFICSGDKNKKILVWTLTNSQPKYTLKKHSAQITNIHYSRKQDYIYSISSDRSLRLWNLRSGKLVRSFDKHSTEVTAMAFSKDETLLASIAGKNVYLWDAQSGQKLAQLTGHKSWVKDIAFSTDNKYLISSSSDKTVKLWSVRSKRNVATLEGHNDQVLSVRQIQNSIVSISRKETIAWNTTTQKPSYINYTGHTSPVNSIVISNDGKWLISGSDDKTIRLWSLKTRKVVTVLAGHNSSILKVAISPQGQFIASGSSDKTIRIWNMGKNKAIFVLFGHKEPVTFVKFHPQGRSIVSASQDRTTRLWNIVTGQEIRTFKEDQALVNDICFSPDGNTIGIAYKTKPAVLLNLGTEVPLAYIDRENKSTRGITYSKDGKFVASATNSIVRLWRAPHNKHVAFFGDHSSKVNSVSYSPNAQHFVSSSDDKTVKVWNVSNKKVVANLDGHNHKVVRVKYIKNYIVGASNNNELYIWSSKDYSFVRSIPGEKVFTTYKDNLAYKNKNEIIIQNLKSGQVTYQLKYKEKLSVLDYSYDGNWLVTGSKSIQLWNLKVADYSYTLCELEHLVQTLVYIRGDQLIFSKKAGVIHVWDLKKREEVQTFEGHRAQITQLIYDSKYHALFSSSKDNSVVWWDLITSKKVSTVAQHRKAVLSIDHYNGVLLTASLDKTIRLWQTLPVSNRQIKTPEWILKIVSQKDEQIPRKSHELLFRNSIPERALDYAMDNEPLRITQYLYHSRVSDTFAIKSIPNLRLPSLGK
ncbi:protein kinase [Candidatus Uabimicrobium sp. HlEnr_7]|uniref:protein kinase domain-containing protein n=1 Tax=Candidatus Uabimicrobium helgolandensis TaxID=3095367 RepID=UPI003555F730